MSITRWHMPEVGRPHRGDGTHHCGRYGAAVGHHPTALGGAIASLTVAGKQYIASGELARTGRLRRQPASRNANSVSHLVMSGSSAGSVW
jgi:hypothetical protein